jgi:cytochrome c-type biogenesis protein CcsB
MLTLAYALLWLALLAYGVHLAHSRRQVGQAATGLAVVAWMLLTGGLVQRGLAAGHWPLTNRYEFALCFTWAILAVYLLLETTWHERKAGAFVLAVALVAATYAVTRPAADRSIAPLLPALRSLWLQIHVLTALVGYAAFAVAAGLGLLLWAFHPRSPLSHLPLPAEDEVAHAMERAIGLGFPWLTLGILTGAIWAQNAWGRYWGWDPKETWALVTWLWYLLVLHARPLRRWRGRRFAALVIAGFALVLFTFAGVPWLVRVVRLESLHGF